MGTRIYGTRAGMCTVVSCGAEEETEYKFGGRREKLSQEAPAAGRQ